MKIQISVLISKAALILLIISASVLMPFRVAAATWGDAPIIGLNITMINIDNERVASGFTVNLDTDQTRWQCVSSHSTMGCQAWISQDTNGNVNSALHGSITANNQNFNSVLYEYEFVFDKPYVGWIQTDFSSTTTGYTPKTIYVNGTSAKFTSNTVYTQFSVTNYSLTYAPLETIEKIRQWNVPVESLNIVLSMMYRNIPFEDYIEYNYFQFPVFNVPSNRVINRISLDANKEMYFIFYIENINIYDLNTFNSYFRVDGGEVTNVYRYSLTLSSYWSPLIRVTIKKNSSAGNLDVTYIGSSTCRLIPFYFNVSSNKNLSTDFALLFGLNNQLLDDLHIIAQGTNESNQQSQDLSSGTDSMQQQMNDLVGVEDSYNQQFNNSVNSIDFSNPLQQNAGLLGASNFVITVFNGLITNNPFSILIIIVCILLIGKKVIGK